MNASGTPDATEPAAGATHRPPAGASTTAVWNGIGYRATAGWEVLRTKEKPTAEIFSVSYVAQGATGTGPADRPVTFVFNGGPGASSAYLHVGAAGPERVDLNDDGTVRPAPARLVHNEESWLAFTDLVFVDPVGTGFSRMIETGKDDDAPDPHAYFGTDRDLQSLCEFIGRWLTANDRWGSPLFLAGESYGGYRVGRLTRMLQETAGISLNGSILLSPALEFGGIAAIAGLTWGDYEVLPWVDVLPTMALAAAHHGRSCAFAPGTPGAEIRRAAEEFATGDLAVYLVRGAAMPDAERERVAGRLADLIGLSPEVVARAEGRIRVIEFVRELLRDERTAIGMYDATVTTTDPFPDRPLFMGSDPTLMGTASTFTTAVNRRLRSDIGVETDREYKLIDLEVVGAWKNDTPGNYNQPIPGATDDFRQGLALNPHLRAFITHGHHDLVTPYYTTNRLRNLMRLDPATADRLTVRHFDGGHMFYTWKESRRELTAALAEFVAEAVRR
ncbi:S10 family peptidase [Pseudonocardia sp. HH130630-07]|uniref:S10 family peptidase n=1 Tax=Pseudonocardia sp. HH130630-07 TaxID=1690815 RepID=UPI000814D233|nr:hypothetical protein [Pseudonocardia sp. HH130630-07]ANY06956.1 hypothetical protein AFB00_12385 [Pseudonocardia sp. HH130630-07]